MPGVRSGVGLVRTAMAELIWKIGDREPIAWAWTTDLLEQGHRPLPPDPGGGLAIPVSPWGLTTVGFELEDA